MIIVTGAAGFIGSCITAKLNEMGREDLILVDHLDTNLKKENLKNKKYVQYYEKEDFFNLVIQDRIEEDITCLIHMGACSSTVLQDEEYFRTNNFEYTRTVAQWALKHNVRFIYASSAATYGDGSIGYSDDDQSIRKCHPLNLYGQSKQDLDLWALENGLLDKMVGLKFFNVFGPNEYHKGDMRSVAAKAYGKVVEEGKMKLFKSYNKNYADGDQKRDFIYVKDVVDVVIFFVKNLSANGIFNVGTGEARSWNDLAHALFKAVGKFDAIEYIEMPEILRGKYQYFTQADMRKLGNSGYTKPFTSLEDAIKDYASYLKDKKHW